MFDDSFKDVKPKSLRAWFNGAKNLSSVSSIENLNTSDVTYMDGMFNGCSSLTKLDLSGFNTANVGSMSGMFNGCSSLTELDLSSFNTANVENMSGMFIDCSSLTSLDLSGFNTANVEYMNGMFNGCSKLTELKLSNFDTSNVTYMTSMFDGCSSLTKLDLSGFNTANVGSMSGMFNGCSSLTELILGSSFNTTNVTDMASMFANCSSLTNLILGSSFNTANVTDMNHMFANCIKLTNLILGSSFNTASVTNMNSMFYRCSSLTKLNLSSFNTANVTDMASMFAGCSNLKEINLTSFNIAKVTRMASMFADCSSLTGLDLSSFNTANVENMASMFAGCSNLKEINLTSFNTANVTNMNFMFYNCKNLEFILKGIDFIIKDNTSTNNMYYNCTSLLKPYVIYCEQDKSLHFTGNAKDLTEITFDGNTIMLADGNRWKGDAVINTTEVPGWNILCNDVSTVVFEENFKNIQPNSCGAWFSGFSNLKEIKGIENLNTSIVTNMYCMFCNCSSLTSLDLRKFNTSNVTDMNTMFYGCRSLTSLDLSSFKTENVTNIRDMFSDCSSLTSLDISNFYMFNMERFNGQNILKNCQDLEMLDLSNCTGYLKEFANFAYEGMEAHQRMIIKVPDNSEAIEGLWRDENYMVTSAGTSFVRQFTEGKMSTVCLPFAVSASNEGGTFYRYDSYDGTDVVFKKVTEGMTEANTAYLFMPSATGKVVFTGTDAMNSLPADIAEGEEAGLYGVYTQKTFTADDADKGIYYGWAQGQFWRAGANAAVNSNRAYLKLPAAAAARLSVRLDGNGTTGISTARSSTDGSTDAPVYNLQGQRVGGSYKGVVIKNGKKMIVK